MIHDTVKMLRRGTQNPGFVHFMTIFGPNFVTWFEAYMHKQARRLAPFCFCFFHYFRARPCYGSFFRSYDFQDTSRAGAGGPDRPGPSFFQVVGGVPTRPINFSWWAEARTGPSFFQRMGRGTTHLCALPTRPKIGRHSEPMESDSCGDDYESLIGDKNAYLRFVFAMIRNCFSSSWV